MSAPMNGSGRVMPLPRAAPATTPAVVRTKLRRETEGGGCGEPVLVRRVFAGCSLALRVGRRRAI
jgi:hypothetical protein